MASADRQLTEGERWSREQLEALLRARFSPPGVARFLIASQRRANAERAARPQAARRMRAWMLAGAAAHTGLAVAGDARARRGLKGALGWWAATWVMLDWHIGMLETEDGRPRNLGPADAVTLTRAWMVPLAARGAGPALCLAAWASDGLDGRLARATEPTRLGRDLEGLVDSCFAAAALRGARRADTIPAWAVAGELARLGGGFGYALWIYFGHAEAPDAAVTRAARLTTPVRVAGLAAAGAGHRRAAGALVAGGSIWSLATVVAALCESRRGTGL
jgi:phosphatidylglycerophosphate synthase